MTSPRQVNQIHLCLNPHFPTQSNRVPHLLFYSHRAARRIYIRRPIQKVHPRCQPSLQTKFITYPLAQRPNAHALAQCIRRPWHRRRPRTDQALCRDGRSAYQIRLLQAHRPRRGRYDDPGPTIRSTTGDRQYTRNVRFCIICNYVNKIILVIQFPL